MCERRRCSSQADSGSCSAHITQVLDAGCSGSVRQRRSAPVFDDIGRSVLRSRCECRLNHDEGYLQRSSKLNQGESKLKRLTRRRKSMMTRIRNFSLGDRQRRKLVRRQSWLVQDHLAGLAANSKPSRHLQLYAHAAIAGTSCHATVLKPIELHWLLCGC